MSLPRGYRRIAHTLLALTLAITNLVYAFTDGPYFFGWEFPDGLSGFFACALLLLAVSVAFEDREDRA